MVTHAITHTMLRSYFANPSTSSCYSYIFIPIFSGLQFSMPEKYVPHRWLSVYDVTVDTVRLLDAYIIFYFAFITSKEDRSMYLPRVVGILHGRKCSAEARHRIREIREHLRDKKLTDNGKLRKKKILSYLFRY